MSSTPNDGEKEEKKIDDEASVDVVPVEHDVADVQDEDVIENVCDEVTENVDVKTVDNDSNDVKTVDNDVVETVTKDPEETVSKMETECDANNDQKKTTEEEDSNEDIILHNTSDLKETFGDDEEDEDDVLDIVAYDEELYITLDHYQEDERDESENPDNVDEKKASETETNQVRQIKNSEKSGPGMDSKEADNTLKDVKESKENAEETGQSVGRSPQIESKSMAKKMITSAKQVCHMFSKSGHCRDPKKLLPHLLNLQKLNEELYLSRPEIKNISNLHAALKTCFDKLERLAGSCSVMFSLSDLGKVREELNAAFKLISQVPWMIKIVETIPSADRSSKPSKKEKVAKQKKDTEAFSSDQRVKENIAEQIKSVLNQSLRLFFNPPNKKGISIKTLINRIVGIQRLSGKLEDIRTKRVNNRDLTEIMGKQHQLFHLKSMEVIGQLRRLPPLMPDISNKTELLVLIKAMIEFVDKYFTSDDEALQEFHGLQALKKRLRESEKYSNQRRSEESDRTAKNNDDRERILRHGKEQDSQRKEKSLENLRLENFALSEAVKMEAQLLEQARLMSSGVQSQSPGSKKPRTGVIVADKVYSKPSPMNPSLQEKFGSRLEKDNDSRSQSDLRTLEDKALEEALKMDAVLMQQVALQKQDRTYFSRPSGNNRDPPTNRALEDRALNEANRIREILKVEESRVPIPIPDDSQHLSLERYAGQSPSQARPPIGEMGLSPDRFRSVSQVDRFQNQMSQAQNQVLMPVPSSAFRGLPEPAFQRGMSPDRFRHVPPIPVNQESSVKAPPVLQSQVPSSPLSPLSQRQMELERSKSISASKVEAPTTLNFGLLTTLPIRPVAASANRESKPAEQIALTNVATVPDSKRVMQKSRSKTRTRSRSRSRNRRRRGKGRKRSRSRTISRSRSRSRSRSYHKRSRGGWVSSRSRTRTRSRSRSRSWSRSRSRSKSQHKRTRRVSRSRDRHRRRSHSRSKSRDRRRSSSSPVSKRHRRTSRSHSGDRKSRDRHDKSKDKFDEDVDNCICCHARKHTIRTCPVFSRSSIKERWSAIFKMEVKPCFRCLSSGHSTDECQVPDKACSFHRSCPIQHHHLIHICTDSNFKPLSDREFGLYRSVQEEVKKLNEAKRRKLEEQLARMLKEQQLQNQALISHVFLSDKSKDNKKDKKRLRKNDQDIIVIEESPTRPSVNDEEVVPLDAPPIPQWIEICTICKSESHKVEKCPRNYCKCCGQQGHQSQSCKFRLEAEEEEAKLRTLDESRTKSVIEYQHSKIRAPPPPSISRQTPKQPTFVPAPQSRPAQLQQQQQQQKKPIPPLMSLRPMINPEILSKPPSSRAAPPPSASRRVYTGALWEHFCKRLLANSKNPEIANHMMDFWSLAGHNEASLREFVSRNKPATRALLRVLFVSELVKAPSSGYPAEVSVDFLLDETTAFFMPVNPEETEEGRIKSLQLLASYISGKMRTMAAMFDINEDYITNVSSMIQLSVAKVGFGHGGLKRHYSAYGKDSLMAILTEKLTSPNVTLPKGVTPTYVVTMVADYVKDSLR